MIRRFIIVVLALACSLTGCKPAADSLANTTATRALEASVFSRTDAVQVASFVSGQPQRPKPYAIENFLYAKHWLECKATQPGLFSTVSVCTLDEAGKTYGRANGWSSAPGPAPCNSCETWTVPIAMAKLNDVTDIASTDKTHGTARYRYTVIPNELGSQLADWMSTNPTAWCGQDARADGDWKTQRTGAVAFAYEDGAWHVTPAATGFDGTFGDTVAASKADRPCTAH